MGVARDATEAQIKQAYRKLARKYHPDVSKEKDAEARFKEVGEAYEVLKSPDKRAAYDQLGQGHSGQEFKPPPDWGSGLPARVPATPRIATSSSRFSAPRDGPATGAAKPTPDRATTITPGCCS